jgi:hypothetical protein
MVKTKYGELVGTFVETFHKNGHLKECMVEACNSLQTEYGVLIPKYQITETRTKHRNAIEFFPSGVLKSIYLEEQTLFQTPLGEIPAELVTFYENGNIHRIFPRYGGVSGYWSEEEEKNLVQNLSIKLPGLEIHNKISCICFYQNTNIKSITFYPGETGNVEHNGKIIQFRLGIAFYENGKVKSLEPARQSVVDTKIGKILAFDNNPLGIHGDENSLEFYESGEIKKVTTEATAFEFADKEKNLIQLKADFRPSLLDIEKQVIVPIIIEFDNEQIEVTDSDQQKQIFSLLEFTGEAKVNKEYSFESSCGECSSCSGCSK